MFPCWSVLMLTFSAGRTVDNYYRHDGSISSFVLLVAATAIITANIFVTVFEPLIQLIERIDGTDIILLSLQILGILSGIFSPVIFRRLQLCTENDENRGQIRIRLVFLMLFAVAGIIHACLHMVCYVGCVMNNSVDISCKIKLLSNALRIVHYPIQIWFFSHFVKFKLKASIIVHYILTCHIAKFFSFWNLYLLQGLSSNTGFLLLHNEQGCGNRTDLQRAVDFTEPYISPAVIAFSLMTVLLLASVWPKYNRKLQHKRQKEDTTENKSLLNKAVEFSPQNNEETYLLSNMLHYVSNRRNVKQPIAVAVAGVVTNVPLLVLTVMHDYTKPVDQVNISFQIIALVSKCAFLIFVSIGYLLLPTQCIAINDRVKLFSLSTFMLVLGMWGLIFFETLNFLGVASEESSLETIVYLVQNLLASITAVQLTIFLLQMKYYKRNGSTTSWLSVENNCLFLAGFLFVYWIIDAFVSPRKLSSIQHKFEILHPYLYNTGTIVFPFVIFFRFQSILFLYEIYKSLKRD